MEQIGWVNMPDLAKKRRRPQAENEIRKKMSRRPAAEETLTFGSALFFATRIHKYTCASL